MGGFPEVGSSCLQVQRSAWYLGKPFVKCSIPGKEHPGAVTVLAASPGRLAEGEAGMHLKRGTASSRRH